MNLPYQYPFFINRFQQFYKGKCVHILILLKFLKTSQIILILSLYGYIFICYFIRYQALVILGHETIWSYTHMGKIWPYGHIGAIRKWSRQDPR